MRGGDVNRLTILTPEGIRFAFELAGPVTRFLAWLTDLAVILLLLNLITIPCRMLAILGADTSMAFGIVAYFVVSVGYGMATEWRFHGQTLGKRLLRLRVIDEQGLPLRFPQVAMRNLLRPVDAMPALYLLGGLVCTLSPRIQRLGDLAAGTVVVRIPRLRQPDLGAIGSGKYNSFREHGHLAARLRQEMTPEEADLGLRALLRRDRLDPEARLELFHELAEHYRTLVTFPESATDGLSDEQYVRNAVEIAYQGGRRAETVPQSRAPGG